MRTQERTMLVAGEDGTVERLHVLEETGKTGRAARERMFNEPFVFLFQGLLTAIARDRTLTASDLRVLLGVMARASQESVEFDSDPQGLARDLAMDVRVVTRSLANLVAQGVIERPRRGKLAPNPFVFWRGTAQSRGARIAERRRQQEES